MPKVTVHEAGATPTQEMLAKAKQEVEVVDSAGRKITLRKPGVLAQFRLVEVLGESASNRTYANMCMPLIYVAAIDGDQVFTPSRKSELEALIQRLDEHGLECVMEAITEHFAPQDPEKDKVALKN